MDTLNQILAREDLITGEHDSDPRLTPEMFPLKFPPQPRTLPAPITSHPIILVEGYSLSCETSHFHMWELSRQFIVHIHVLRNLAFRALGNSF